MTEEEDTFRRSPLSSNHRHGGGAQDGNPIPARNIERIYQYRFIPATEFDITDANISLKQFNEFEVLEFADAVSSVTTVNIWLPTFRKVIKSLKLIYWDRSASSLNIRLAFAARRGRVGSTPVTDSLAEASYATVGTAGDIQEIEIPKDAWDDLSPTQWHDIIGLEITRNAAAATDTYNNDLEVLGLLVEFN